MIATGRPGRAMDDDGSIRAHRARREHVRQEIWQYRVDMHDLRTKLANHLHGLAAPFLFVGAGLSRRYVQADSWEALLRRFAEETGQPYDYFRASAEGKLPKVATKISHAFHDLWWKDDRFATSRARWQESVDDTETALKVEVAQYLEPLSSALPDDGVLGEELDLLRNAVFDGIITTNYDDILESLFPDYKVYVGQDELLFAKSYGIAEIYKIHGSCTDPSSLVLTAADYERFEARNTYLAAKLMTIFVEHPVIFLGYSLGDQNVLSILRSIARCLTQENIEDLRDRLIFVKWDPDSVGEIESHTILVDDFVLNVKRIAVPDFRDVFAVLADLKRSFPAKLLRQLKEQVYELVSSNDPRGRLKVVDIDDDTAASDLDVVFGVGVAEKLAGHGYLGLTRWDLIEDAVFENKNYDARTLVDDVLPTILRQPGFVPVFKALRVAGELDDQGNIARESRISEKITKMAARISSGMPSSTDNRRKAPAVLKDSMGIADLEQSRDRIAVYTYGTCLPEEKVSPAEIREFLQREWPLFKETQWMETQYIKLACFLDWVEHGSRDAGS